MERLERLIEVYRFLSFSGFFVFFCVVMWTIFYFIKKDVKGAIGVLTGATAKKEIHRLQMANKRRTDENIQTGKSDFVIIRQIVCIHTTETLERGNDSYEERDSVIT